MKNYSANPDAPVSYGNYNIVLIVLVSFVLAIGCSIFISSSTVNRLNRSPAISCAPASFFDTALYPTLEEIQINDNRQPGGELRNGIYYIDLDIREGYWYPDSKQSAPIKIKAFAEAGKPLQVPGPLIRVPEGTEIRARVRNRINGRLALYGFSKRLYRPGDRKDSIVIEKGATREILFNAGAAGTTLYTAKDEADTVTPALIATPFLNSQLYGAMIIDAANEKIDPKERLFMIGMCGVGQKKENIRTRYVINGLSWPHTELVSYRQGETVNWRVINASVLAHPMHLHGFPFVVNNLTSGQTGKDSVVPVEKRREVVTQFLFPMNKMSITWTPAKEGNWLFHCHLLDHVLPASFERDGHADHSDTNVEEHARNGMGGLVLGIRVHPDKKYAKNRPAIKVAERKLRLLVGDQPNNHFKNVNGKGFQLLEKEMAVSNNYSIPGPPIILTKDQPVAITVVNKLKEPTTIHWHGLEIESYFDGVAGWGNAGKKLAPLIQPGDSFTVHITPPRAGSYMYHTHMHDLQLLDGLYGPLIVLEPGKTYQPETDKTLLISQGATNTVFTRNWVGGFTGLGFLMNGSNKPPDMIMKKDSTYRLRVINIIGQENSDFTDLPRAGFYISLKKDGKPVMWKLIDQDGMNMPARLHETRAAINQRCGPGTIRDFEFTPDKSGSYRFEVIMDQQIVVTQVMNVNE